LIDLPDNTGGEPRKGTRHALFGREFKGKEKRFKMETCEKNLSLGGSGGLRKEAAFE